MSDNVVAQFSYLLNQWHEMATISYKILYYYTLLNIVDCLRKFYVNWTSMKYIYSHELQNNFLVQRWTTYTTVVPEDCNGTEKFLLPSDAIAIVAIT